MKRKFLFIFLLLYMSFIFYLSSEPANISHSRNRKIIETVKITTGKDIDKKVGRERLNFYVRKNAHFFLFMFLGSLSLLYINHIKIKNKFLIAFIFCFLYAISDEVHQYFVPGRGPRVMDVFIDSAGALIGISFIKIINWKSKRIVVK
ncbi:VanZ family protein [Caloramator sp. ALD01]|uniref:VanZ family protein n=1 Tax=Caloramator sp. ALD01 TaxID=1031288 RepID=UPI0004870E12|nr:VanZ family protein [Caloramator sp. ALD01]